MGVENCLDCGGNVADSARNCPHCGSAANYLNRIDSNTRKNLNFSHQLGNVGMDMTRYGTYGCLVSISILLLLFIVFIAASVFG